MPFSARTSLEVSDLVELNGVWLMWNRYLILRSDRISKKTLAKIVADEDGVVVVVGRELALVITRHPELERTVALLRRT